MIFDFFWLGLALSVQTWDAFETRLPSIYKKEPGVYQQNAVSADELSGKVVLYRDSDGLCPYSQQVWLALEAKGIDYATVLTDETDVPRLSWPDGTVQIEPLEILERIQTEFPELPPNLYAKNSLCVDSVRCNIVRFRGVFPRNTKMTKRTPYLVRNGGELVPSSDHMVTLEETDEVMDEYDDGPFLVGLGLSAADCVWAPFLERYAAQLPMIHSGSEHVPRSREYPAIKEWFEAMETLVPSYSCRVGGDATFWRRILEEDVENGEFGEPRPKIISSGGVLIDGKDSDSQGVWERYAEGKPWLASSPEAECAAYVIRDRDAISEDARVKLNMESSQVDLALREVVGALLSGDGVEELSESARGVAIFLNKRLCVPRDLGAIPASALRKLVAAIKRKDVVPPN